MRLWAVPLFIVATVGTAAVAVTAVPRTGDVFLSSCRQGQCLWQRVVRLERSGDIVRLQSRRGTSVHLDGRLPRRARDARIEWQSADRSDIVRCSRQSPAFAFESEAGRFVVHFLDFHALAGYQYASASSYWRLCHGRSSVPSPAVLNRLGYRPGTRSEQLENLDRETVSRFSGF